MIPIRFDEAMVAQIDAAAVWFSSKNRGVKFTRSDAARVLMTMGLAEQEGAAKRAEPQGQSGARPSARAQYPKPARKRAGAK